MERKSERRDKVYNFIIEFIFDYGYSPTIREICDGVGLNSLSSVHYHLQMLEKMGKIKLKTGCPRAICIL